MGCSSSKQHVAEPQAASKTVSPLRETAASNPTSAASRCTVEAASIEGLASCKAVLDPAGGRQASHWLVAGTVKNSAVPACIFREQIHFGFKTIPEKEVLTCGAESMAPYTLPAEALTFEPTSDVIMTRFSNGDQERKIHCNVELQERELERLAVLQGEAKAEGLRFFPSVAAMATRFLSSARMDAKKALRMMQATHEWRQHYFKDGPITDAAVRNDMQHGIVYFVGRDQALRPVIVIRAARIPQQWYKEKSVDKLIRILVFCMEYFLGYMVVPGRVENLSVIVNMNGIGIGQVPLGALRDIYKVMSHHYTGRVYRFYVCNVSPALQMIAGMAKSLLTDRQRQKLVVVENVQDFRKEFALHQIEEDLGGLRPPVTQFFPFPLEAGPFEAGYAAGPDRTGATDVHEVLTREGARGSLWDPRSSEEENTKLEFHCRPEAVEILTRCNLPVPTALLPQGGDCDR